MQFLVPDSIFQPTTPVCQEGKNPSEYCNFFPFADGGKQTWSACAASECAIHYTLLPLGKKAFRLVVYSTRAQGVQ